MEIDLKRLQMMELEMAKVLLDVCDKHGLRIWADGGTLLGAVRHQGFIPWDDDMDFTLFRDDYDKLKTIAKTEVLPEPYYFEINQTLIRLKHKGTTMFAKNEKYPGKHGGGNGGDVWIDIVCMDTVPPIDDEFKKKWAAIRQYDRMGKNCASMTFAKSKGIVSKTWHLYCLLFYSKKRAEKIDCFCKQYNKTDNDFVTKTLLYLKMGKFLDAGKLPLFNKHWYNETVLLPFDGISIPCPKNYDEALRTMYGDTYMTPLRESSIHGEVIVDLDRPYEEVVKELLHEIPWWKRFLYKY